MKLIILQKGRPFAEGTHRVHGGRPVVKRRGKWVPDRQALEKPVKHETKEPEPEDFTEKYEEGAFIPKEDLPDDLPMFWKGSSDVAGLYRIPKDFIHGGIKKHGYLFFVHNAVGTYTDPNTGDFDDAFVDRYEVTEATTGRALPRDWGGDTDDPQKVLKETVDSIESEVGLDKLKKVIKENQEQQGLYTPTQTIELPFRKESYHRDTETISVLQDILAAASVSSYGNLSSKEVLKWAEVQDVYLPNIVAQHTDDFTPNDWYLAFTLDTHVGDLNKIPDFRRLAEKWGLDPIKLGEVWTHGPDGYGVGGIANDLEYIQKYGDPQQGDISEAVNYAAKYGLDISDAYEQSFDMDTGEPKEEEFFGGEQGHRSGYGVFIPDSMIGAKIHNYPLDGLDVESLTLWSKGDSVPASRSTFQVDYDKTVKRDRAEYYTPNEKSEQMARVFENMSRFTKDWVLYRGTPSSGKWLNMQEGDEVPFGCGSFSRDEDQAEKFMHNDGVMIELRVDGAHRKEGLYGVDIGQMDTLDGAEIWREKNNLEAYVSEDEVVARASHLRILSVDQEHAYIVAEPVYRGMELNKAELDADKMRILEIKRFFDEIFNQSLGEQRVSMESEEQ